MQTFEPFTLPRDAIVYTADIEGNGLYWGITKVWSLVIRDYWTGKLIASCRVPLTLQEAEFDGPERLIEHGLPLLNNADYVIFHNGIKYDVPVLKKLYPWWEPRFILLDSLVLSRLVFANEKLREMDAERNVPGAYFGSHSLEGWGYRLNFSKSVAGKDDPDFWQQWSPEMQQRCEGDTEITRLLMQRILEEQPSRESVELEHAIATLMFQQEMNGFPFDVDRAVKLYGKLAQERTNIERRLQEIFPPRWVDDGRVPYVKDRRRWTTTEDGRDRRKEYTQDDEDSPRRWTGNWLKGYWTTYVGNYHQIHLENFNPGSRQQIHDRLHKKYGWEPKLWTPSGQAKVDDEILAALPYPEAQELARYFLIEKRIGQLAEGDQAWLKAVHEDGCIHGEVNPGGTVTGRATHSNPNVSQVPGNDAEYGVECRSLWTTVPGWVLVGSDTRKLELVCLAHYLARYDGGAYKLVVLTGDPHTRHQEAAGLPTRKQGKTFGYAYLYGGGDEKLGSLAPPTEEEKALYVRTMRDVCIKIHKRLKRQRRAGTVDEVVTIVKGGLLRARFQREITGLEPLREALKDAVKRSYIVGLDGRHVFIRKEHAALNTLLQSAGAIICKRWLVILDQILRNRGLIHGWDGDYAFCAWSHDEAQIAAKPEHAKLVGKAARVAARLAGRYYGLRCPVSADVKVGRNWAETH